MTQGEAHLTTASMNVEREMTRISRNALNARNTPIPGNPSGSSSNSASELATTIASRTDIQLRMKLLAENAKHLSAISRTKNAVVRYSR